tara:strand:- start:318 stop:1256 length:939 start_codon:yes stop_codon:yes gene_type:complete
MRKGYIPNSKILKGTSQGELLYIHNNEKYYGPYIETSDGEFYEGISGTNFGLQLYIETDEGEHHHENPFNYSKDIELLHLFKPGLKTFFGKVKDIPSGKPSPTFDDYGRGYFKRYFKQRINGTEYSEISKNTYKSIQSKDGTHDHILYRVGHIVWHIKGLKAPRLNLHQLNKANRKFPKIMSLFPILDEYLKVEDKVIEDQNTTGGELYRADGSEYIGVYHIHPSRGPMEGATHSHIPHPKLYYLNQFPKVGNTPYEEFLNEYNKITCYKCHTINENHQIVSSQTSRLLGCPADSYEDYELAEESCFKTNTN